MAAVIATVLQRIDAIDSFRHVRNSWSAMIHTTAEDPCTKAILEVMDQHPHRVVVMGRDFGIACSVFGSTCQDVVHHQKLCASDHGRPSPGGPEAQGLSVWR
jgi:hypothetical protein